MPSAGITGTSRDTSPVDWVSIRFDAKCCRSVIWSVDCPPAAPVGPSPLGSRLQLGIEIGDHILECGNRLLNRGNLHQLPVVDRAFAILQRDDQIAALLLELNQW